MSSVTKFNRSTLMCLNYISVDCHVVIIVKIQDFGKCVSFFEVYRPTFYTVFKLAEVNLNQWKITNPGEIGICPIR